MIDKKKLEKKLKKATKKGLLDMWASKNKEDIINEFSLVPAPEQIKSMIDPFPFRINRRLIQTAEEWKGYPQQKKLPVKNNKKKLPAKNDKEYLPVKKYKEEWFWFTSNLEPKKLSHYRNNEMLIEIDSEMFSLLDFVEFKPVFFISAEDIHVYYKVKKIDADTYMLDVLCPYKGECNNGGKCPGKEECKKRIKISPDYEPFLVDHAVYPTLKDYEDIWKSVPKKTIQKTIVTQDSNKNEVHTIESDHQVTNKDFQQTTKDHYEKKQKEWIFTIQTNKKVNGVVPVTWKPSKELQYYDNIFTLPPLLSYSEAKKLDTRKVHFYSLTKKTFQKDIQGGYKKGKILGKVYKDEYLIPFTSECSVKTLLGHWPIIQTFQAISVGRKKGTTQYMKSKKKDDITLFIEKYLARKKDPQRKGRMDRQRLLLSSLCPFAKKTIEEAMYNCRDYLTELPEIDKKKYKVTKICKEQASCDKDCPLKTKGQIFFVET